MKRKSVFVGLVWRLMERFSISFIQFVLQIVLARLLSPEHYGVLSIMIIFTSLATVFIQAGFNTALIQNKDVTDDDYSSVLWVALMIATLMYGAIYIGAPTIGRFYDMPGLVAPLRVLALMLFPGVVNSVQLAKVSREMDFKKVFTGNVGAVLVSGAVGLVMAYAGYGVWALVGQALSNIVVACLMMGFTVKLKFRFVCDFKRIRVLLAFGWKILVINLMDTLYQDLRSLVIGKKYDSTTLGYYNRGKQFPQFIILAINSSVQSVLLPAMSAEQDETSRVKALTRRAVTTNSYIMLPIMMGLAAVAEPLITLLLTEKWLPCVPYLQIYCLSMAFYPAQTSNLQAVNAIGRSDVYLKLDLVKQGYGILLLVVALVCFQSPIAVAVTELITTLAGTIITVLPNKKLIGYSLKEHMQDLMAPVILACVMAAVVYAFNFLAIPLLLKLIVQIIVGAAVYVALSATFRVQAFLYIFATLKNTLFKKRA